MINEHENFSCICVHLYIHYAWLILVPRCKYLLFIRVGEIVESALSELSAIISALSAYFINFQQKIPYFDVSRQKRVLFSLALTDSLPVSLWLSMALCDSHSGTLWL